MLQTNYESLISVHTFVHKNKSKISIYCTRGEKQTVLVGNWQLTDSRAASVAASDAGQEKNRRGRDQDETSRAATSFFM